MRKSAVILLFIAILLGGIILSVGLVAEPSETKSIKEEPIKEEPGYYETPTGLAYGKPSIVAEKSGISISQLRPGEPPFVPARQTAGYVQVILKIGGN